jgi:hypothetical protein
MTELDFLVNIKKREIISAMNNRYGYLVLGQDGDQSWLPTELFEKYYREITDEEKRLVEPTSSNR